MPIGTTSKRVASIAPSTPPAVAQLIECSLDRPPNRRATRIMTVLLRLTVSIHRCAALDRRLALLALRYRCVGRQMGGDVSRLQRTGQHFGDLADDGHLDAHLGRQLED